MVFILYLLLLVTKFKELSCHIHSSSHLTQIRRLWSSQPDRPLLVPQS